MAQTPETSLHTSIHARIHSDANHLLAFDDERAAAPLPCQWQDYLELVDWTGRQWRPGKRGRIDADAPPILERMDTNAKDWLRGLKTYTSWHRRAFGSVEALRAYCEHLGQRWLMGLKHHLSHNEPVAGRA